MSSRRSGKLSSANEAPQRQQTKAWGMLLDLAKSAYYRYLCDVRVDISLLGVATTYANVMGHQLCDYSLVATRLTVTAGLTIAASLA